MKQLIDVSRSEVFRLHTTAVRFAALFLTVLNLPTISVAQSIDNETPSAIRAVMTKALTDWNAGNLEAFATCYKNAPDILFVGPHIRRGYAGLLDGYRKAYPSRAEMGILSFSEIEVQPLDAHFATMTGRFHLQRSDAAGGSQDGYYLLVYEKTAAGWKIIRDDSTIVGKPPK